MDEGPTTVGSINAKLKIDKSDWDAKLDAAKASAAELSAVDPTIEIKTKGFADAEAKIKAVELAQGRLNQAEARADTAYARAELAQKRLNTVLEKRGRTELQVMSATLAHTEAQNRLTSANEKAILAEEALNAVRAQGIAEAQKPAASSNAAGPAGFAQIALVAVLALLPLLGPLAGAFAAVTGTIMGMGAAGILAILGIHNAMVAGTAVGDAYATGLHNLKGSLDSLAGTAANAMLLQFQIATQTINSDLPSLNSEIRVFSTMLGTAGNIVLSTLVAGFKILNPLFVQAGVFIEQIAVGWQRWTTGGGLAKFAQDAVAALPQVNMALGSLLKGVIDVIGGLQPLGLVMLQILTVVSNLASMLATGLGPAFAPIVAGALAMWGGFQLFGLAEPIIVKVATAMVGLAAAEDLALGPIGWVVAGISALVAIFAIATTSANSATAAQQNYTAAVQADNGVIGENVRAQTAKALADAGAIDAAKKLGINTQELTSAALGHDDALRAVNGTLNAANASLSVVNQQMGRTSLAQRELRANIDTVSKALVDNKTGIDASIKSYNDIATALGQTTISTQAELEAQKALAASYGESVPVYLTANAAQKTTADQLVATTAAMVQANDAAGLLTNAFTLLNGGSLSVAQAQTGLAAANNTLTTAFQTNGLIVDGNTAAAVANQQAIQGQVLAAQQAADAIAKQTGSTKAGVQAYSDSKTALEAQLSSQGLLTDQVQAYIDKLYAVNDFKPALTKFDADTAAAVAKVQQLRDLIGSLPGGVGLSLTATGSVIYSDAQNSHYASHAGGGEIGGIGTGTSDSNLIWASKGEHMVTQMAASYPGVRPMLNSLNNNPARTMGALAGMANGSGGGGKAVTNHNAFRITTNDPHAAAYTVLSLMNEMAAV